MVSLKQPSTTRSSLCSILSVRRPFRRGPAPPESRVPAAGASRAPCPGCSLGLLLALAYLHFCSAGSLRPARKQMGMEPSHLPSGHFACAGNTVHHLIHMFRGRGWRDCMGGKKDFSLAPLMRPEQRRPQQLRRKPVLWMVLRWFSPPHFIHLSCVIGIRGNNPGPSSSFSRAPSDHQLGSGRSFFFFFLARETVSHNSLQLVPNAHACLSRSQQVWGILDDASSCFPAAIFLHYMLALPSTCLLSECLFLIPLFSFTPCPFPRPPPNELSVHLGFGALSSSGCPFTPPGVSATHALLLFLLPGH